LLLSRLIFGKGLQLEVIAGGIPKPLQLVGNARFLPRLRQFQTRNRPTQNDAYTIDPDGRVTGRSGLSQTGAYPTSFGTFVEQCYTRSRPIILREVSQELVQRQGQVAEPVSSLDAQRHFFLKPDF